MRIVRAAFASRFDDADPLAALTVGDRPEPALLTPDFPSRAEVERAVGPAGHEE